MANPPEDTYVRRGKLLRVIDGDTAVLLVDCGFYLQEFPIRVRVHGLWAPEITETGGPQATRYLNRLLVNKELRLKSYRDQQSYDRWVADVWVRMSKGWESVAERVIAAGHGTAQRETASES